MPDATSPTNITLPPRTFHPLAALLSYLVPGLGQIVQGRYGKGLLFMVCLLGLFFYGMYLGSWRNVYIDSIDEPQKGPQVPSTRRNLFELVINKAPFIAQFPIGVVAWPAIIQYASQPTPAFVNPRDGTPLDANGQPIIIEDHPLFGKFMRRPSENEQNDLQRNGDKYLNLGWTYTLIAGVLNVLVIYDALAGAAFTVAAASVARPSSSMPSSEKSTVI